MYHKKYSVFNANEHENYIFKKYCINAILLIS